MIHVYNQTVYEMPADEVERCILSALGIDRAMFADVKINFDPDGDNAPAFRAVCTDKDFADSAKSTVTNNVCPPQIRKPGWAAAEDEIIRRYYPTESLKQLCGRLGYTRTEKAISLRAAALRVKKNRIDPAEKASELPEEEAEPEQRPRKNLEKSAARQSAKSGK